MATPSEATERLPVARVETLDASNLQDWALSADQIVAGSPRPRGVVTWRDEHNTAVAGFWECTPGAFERAYAWTEVAVILEGAGHLTFNGVEQRLAAGTLVVIERGATARWAITQTVRKSFQLSAPDPLPL